MFSDEFIFSFRSDLSSQGVRVPEVLRKYVPGGIDFIPYTKELPKDSTSSKAKGKPGANAPATVAEATDKLSEVKV